MLTQCQWLALTFGFHTYLDHDVVSNEQKCSSDVKRLAACERESDQAIDGPQTLFLGTTIDFAIDYANLNASFPLVKVYIYVIPRYVHVEPVQKVIKEL